MSDDDVTATSGSERYEVEEFGRENVEIQLEGHCFVLSKHEAEQLAHDVLDVAENTESERRRSQ